MAVCILSTAVLCLPSCLAYPIAITVDLAVLCLFALFLFFVKEKEQKRLEKYQEDLIAATPKIMYDEERFGEFSSCSIC